MVMMIRITTAVDRRLGFGYDDGYTNSAPEFTKALGLADRLSVLRAKLLKKAVKIELDELAFWMKELRRPQVDFQTVRMLAQRIRTLREGLPIECVADDHEEQVSFAIRKHAIVFAKQKLREIKKQAVTGFWPDDNERIDFLRFIRIWKLSMEDLGYSKMQFHNLTQQAKQVAEEIRKEYLRKRELRRQNK